MGTRNLTLVKSNHQTKVAQYGQWDGYPAGSGSYILKFLKYVDLNHFRAKVNALQEISDKEVDAILKKDFNVGDSGFVSMDISKRIYKEYPQFHRNTGSQILAMIYNGDTDRVNLYEDFLQDGLFCEWAYEIDLDNNVLNVYANGANKVASYPLNSLPNEDDFISELNGKVYEED